MAKPIRATRLQRNLIRGVFSLFALGAEDEESQRRIVRNGERVAGALRDGISIEIRATDEDVGIGLRRHRKPRTLPRPEKKKGSRR